MGLYERLMGVDPSGVDIPVHTFYALMTERKRGKVTNQEIIDALNLSAGEQTELTTLWNRVNSNQLTGPEVHEVLIIAADGEVAAYDTVAELKTRLGV